MVFKAHLPELADLCRIAGSIESYPASPDIVAKAAASLGYGSNIIEFINLFSNEDSVEFENRIDFYTRAAELAMLICEERITPKEVQRNPQD